MPMFLKYIVFLFFCFNISALQAAEVIYEFDENESERPVSDLSARINLPHAERLREILEDSDSSPTGRILILGKYFDEKYPDKAIETDFSQDVAAIFPELTQQEVYERTNLIRHAVNLYRAGTQKYTEIKEKLLAPEEPPLLVDEEDYDRPGLHPYIEAPEGQVAVVYDFKKVLSYGNNPRDIKAMEAYRQRQADSKLHKTTFDKFKSMVGKLEFSKLPFYGYSLPDPFVGNAGVGEWQSKDGFSVRLISDTAEIGNKTDILAAAHIRIPNHRFVTANSISDKFFKPEIELIEHENVESYKVYYPLPVKVADDGLIGAYAGDPAFPITVTLSNPQQGVRLKAKVTLQSCDYDLNCEKTEFFPELVIDAAEENANSAMMNFVKQSYYNLPRENNKNLRLKNIKTTLSEDGKELEKIQFVFDFSGSVNNFSLFLEDKLKSRFQMPKIAVHGSEIYATVVPDNHKENLLNQEAELTVRLNAYTSLRQKIKLADFSLAGNADFVMKNTIFYFVLSGLLAGVLFAFMPIALPLWGLRLPVLCRLREHQSCFWANIAGIFTGFNLWAFTVLWLQRHEIPLVWGMQYQNFYYLSAIVLFLTALLISAKYTLPVFQKYPLQKNFVTGFAPTLLLPYSFTPLLAENVYALLSANKPAVFLFFNALAAGFAALYWLFTRMRIKDATQRNKLYQLVSIVSCLMLIGMIVWLSFVLYLQIAFTDFCKIVFLLLATILICGYALSFLQALARTDLPENQKITTEWVVAIILLALFVFAVRFVGRTEPIRQDGTSFTLTAEGLNEKLQSGEIIMIGVTADWCPLCRFNDATVLNERNLQRWKQIYRFKYFPLNIRDKDAAFRFLRHHKYAKVPFYVLYSYNFTQGLVISPFLIDTKLEQIIEDAGV